MGKYRRAAVPQVTGNVNAGRDQIVRARTVRYNRPAVHQSLVTMTDAHLRGRKTPHGFIEKGIRTNESPLNCIWAGFH